MTDKAARPERSGRLTRADLSPSYPTPSPDVGRLVTRLRSWLYEDPENDDTKQAVIRQAADLIVSQQGEIERLEEAIHYKRIESDTALKEQSAGWMAVVTEVEQRATKEEALLVKAREGLERIVELDHPGMRPGDFGDGVDYARTIAALIAKDALLAITEALG